jgi:hypothetical protein
VGPGEQRSQQERYSILSGTSPSGHTLATVNGRRFGDRQYPSEFVSGAVTAHYLLPPSQGFGGAIFVFTR